MMVKTLTGLDWFPKHFILLTKKTLQAPAFILFLLTESSRLFAHLWKLCSGLRIDMPHDTVTSLVVSGEDHVIDDNTTLVSHFNRWVH